LFITPYEDEHFIKKNDMDTKRRCKTSFLGAWLEPEIKALVVELAGLKGVSLSEYLRNLVIDDLDRRQAFTERFRRAR